MQNAEAGIAPDRSCSPNCHPAALQPGCPAVLKAGAIWRPKRETSVWLSSFGFLCVVSAFQTRTQGRLDARVGFVHQDSCGDPIKAGVTKVPPREFLEVGLD